MMTCADGKLYLIEYVGLSIKDHDEVGIVASHARGGLICQKHRVLRLSMSRTSKEAGEL